MLLAEMELSVTSIKVIWTIKMYMFQKTPNKWLRATVKSYRKMRDDALSGDPIAKVRYEKTLAMRREAYHAKKSEQTA